jgi:hypothetical protein
MNTGPKRKSMKTLALPAWLMLLALSTLILEPSTATAQGTAFLYQGRLNAGGSPANGIYDFQFTVCDAATNGDWIGGPVTNSATTVANGLFTVTLDFGNVFNGSSCWLEIAVRTNGGGAFTALNPRQPLAPAPYAIYAANAATAGALSSPLPGGGLSGAYSSALALTNAANQFAGSFAGNGAGLTNLSGGGNFIVIPAGSDTPAVQAALSLGTNVQFAPGTYTLTNLTLANNTHIWGYGATLRFAPGSGGFLIDQGTNTCNTIIEGVCFDGMHFSNYFTGPPYVVDNSAVSGGLQLYFQNPAVTWQNGVRVNGGGNNQVLGCTFRGFCGVAMMLVDSNSSLSFAFPSHAVITGNNIYSNLMGIYCVGAGYDYPAFPYNGQAFLPPTTAPEYHVISGNYIFSDGVAVSIWCGNVNLNANILGNNYCCVEVGWGENPGHGLIIGNILNHSHFGVRLDGGFGETEMGAKDTVLDNAIYSTDFSLWDDGAPWVEFANNSLAQGPFDSGWVVTNSTATLGMTVFFHDNAYLGQWGISYTNQVSFGAGSGMAYTYGNHSLDHIGDTDGSAASLIDIGNLVFTNRITAGGFASGAANRGLIAPSGWTNDTGVNCVAYVSGPGINITNFDGSGNAYMTNRGVTDTTTILMQPGAKLQTSHATGFYHAQ